MLRLFTSLLPFFVILLLLCGWMHQGPSAALAQTLIASATPPSLFTDDGDRQSLLSCARIHRAYLANLPAGYQSTIAGKKYPLSWLLLSMDEFITLLENTPDPQDLSNHLKNNFITFKAVGRPDRPAGEMLVTGYYEPLFAGSLQRKSPYIYPLYALPKSLISNPHPDSGKKTVGRLSSNGTLAPFWTRAEIEKKGYLAGNELVYLKDPFEVFLVHVQGSARIVLPDGSQKAVRFAGHNGHTYKSIGKLLVDEGKLSLKETSIPTIRSYLDQHPDELQRILHYNPRYIFFSWGGDMSPRGSLGRPLTPGRSIAIDRKALPDSLFGWLQTSIPDVDGHGQITGWKTSNRFVLPQDSGAAIQGPGRVDMFWGNGLYAETAAGNMKEKGQLYFFIKKGYRDK